jgi:PEP-CTERM motif
MRNFLNGIKTLGMVTMLLIFGGGTARAVTGDVYSDTFQGITFTFTEVDANTLSFNLKGTPLPDWNGINFLDAFALKDLGLNFTTTTGVANGPGATNLAGVRAELNNSGNSADCAVTGETGSICFDIIPDTALTPTATAFDMTYTIEFSSNFNIASTGPHLKIAFTAIQDGDKVGSFYSQNVPLDHHTPSVPEPSTAILLGSGLVILGVSARRRFRRG